MSRQNYYARRQQRQRRQVDGELVAELVRQERAVQSRVGVKKLHRMLKEALQEAGVVLDDGAPMFRCRGSHPRSRSAVRKSAWSR